MVPVLPHPLAKSMTESRRPDGQIQFNVDSSCGIG